MLGKEVSTQRKIIYLISFLTFFVMSSIILFFAFGYRFNMEDNIFIHSGSITINPTPKKVDIFLNNKKIERKFYDLINDSYNIDGIKPGSYPLRVEAPGFHSWEKEINVHSGIATEFWNVVLVPKNLQKERLDIVSPSFFKVAEGGGQILFATKREGPLSLFIYEEKEEKSFKIFEDSLNKKEAAKFESAEFSPDKELLIYSLEEGSKINYYLAFLEDIKREGINNENTIYLNDILLNFYNDKAILKEIMNNDEEMNKLNQNLKTYLIRNYKKLLNSEQANNDNSKTDLKDDEKIDEDFTEQINQNFKYDLIQNKPPFLNSTEINETKSLEAQITDLIKAKKHEKLSAKNFKWLDNNQFYFMLENDLYLNNLNKREIKKALNDIKNYEVSQEKIYFIKGEKNLIFNSNYHGDLDSINQITSHEISCENEKKEFKLFVYDEKRIAILEKEEGRFYLYNNNDNEYNSFKELGENIKSAQFSDDGKKLLYFSQNLIKVYYLKEWDVQPKNDVGSNITIIDNQNTSIKDAMWHENYQHILYYFDSKINLIEIDLRGNINEETITETQVENPKFTYDTHSEKLYYLNQSDKFIQLFRSDFPQRKLEVE